MSKYLKIIFFIFITFAFLSCRKEPTVQTVALQAVSTTTTTTTEFASASTSAPAQLPAEPTKPQATHEVQTDWLAKLTQQSNQVEYRKRNQNIWRQTDGENSFLKYDALQTKSSSFAEVVYKSGSTLDVRENTLIIFDEDPGKKKKNEDRVIIKNGQLTGKTKTELWIFTDSGLVQIKAKKEKNSVKAAEAKVAINSDRAVNIQVTAGTAEVVYKKETDFTRATISSNAELTIKPSTELTSGTIVNADKVAELASAEVKVVKSTPADLIVSFPEDNALVYNDEIEVRGHVTGTDAKLLINGQLANISDDKNFTKKIALQVGTNLIVFQLIRSDATVKFVRRSVRFQSK